MHDKACILSLFCNELNKFNNKACILSLFCNELNKFNNIGAQMLDSIYYMPLTLLKCCRFGLKMSRFCHLFRNVILDVITLHYQICKPLVVLPPTLKKVKGILLWACPSMRPSVRLKFKIMF